MTTLSVVRMCLAGFALNLLATSARGAPPPPTSTGGDAEAQKLVIAAMETDYLKMNFDAAKKKLSHAALTCRRKGCATGFHATIHGYFAVIHWFGEDARDLAHDDLRNMLKIDLEQRLDIRYATEEIEDAWEKLQGEMRKVVAEEKKALAAREAEEKKEAARKAEEERKVAAAKAAEDVKKAEEDRKVAAAKAEADRKEAARKAEEDKKIATVKALEDRRVAAAKQADANRTQAIKDAEEKLARENARYADEQRAAAETAKVEAARRVAEETRRGAEEKKEAERKVAEDTKRLAEDRKEAARREAEERKTAAKRAEDDKKEAAARKADEAKRAADEKREAAKRAEDEKKEAALKAADDAKKAADEKREAALKAADDAKKAADEKREAARKADEERREAAKRAEDEKKEAALKAADDAKKAAEEKREAARKEAADKREAALKEAADKKEAAFKAAEEAKKAADEKREAARKAAEDAKKAEEDRRMRVPPPVGKLVEAPWKEQAVGYPIPIVVKIPPPPARVEKPRIEVVKVVAEYSAPGFNAPRQIELKPEKEGAWVGLLPCDATLKDGEVTYHTSAFNKFDNAVARSGSVSKPNKVAVKAELVSSLPHWPGELPPESCADSQSKAKAAADAKCSASPDGCPSSAPPPLCEGSECGGDDVPAALAANQPKHFGCVSCRVGARSADPEWEPLAWLALALGFAGRRRARRAA